jgi:hypothetical protein
MADETKQEAAPVDLTAARARHSAATPGPWRWYGNTGTQNAYLATEAAGLRWKVAAAERSASEEKARADRLAAENAALRSKPFEADGLPPYAEIAAAYEKGYGIRERAENHADLRNGLEAAVDLATERLRCRLGALAFDLEVLAAEGGSAADLVEKMRARGHLP